ncbi:MAG: tetratricopeptide repeat protein [Pirellulales bacterium]
MSRLFSRGRTAGRGCRSALALRTAGRLVVFAIALVLLRGSSATAQHRGGGGHSHGGGHHHGGGGHHHHGGFNRSGFGGGFGFGGFGGGFGFGGWNNTTLIVGGGFPYYGGFYGGGLNYFNGPIFGGGLWGGLGWSYPFYMPPVVVPAETWFGPRAMDRFLGLGPDSATLTLMQPQLLANQVLVPPVNAAPANAAGGNAGAAKPVPRDLNGPEVEHDRARPVPKVRETNDEVRARAARRLALGDNDYRAQRYGEAYSTYRRAAEIAPDLYEAYFRQGQALIALRRYDDSLRAFKRGLDLDPNWPRRPMLLADLYGPNQAAQLAHLEGLAKEAVARPGDASPILLLGIELYASGQLERSRRFFEQAAALAGDAPLYADLFLRELNQAENPPRIAAAPDAKEPAPPAPPPLPGVEL